MIPSFAADSLNVFCPSSAPKKINLEQQLIKALQLHPMVSVVVEGKPSILNEVDIGIARTQSPESDNNKNTHMLFSPGLCTEGPCPVGLMPGGIHTGLRNRAPRWSSHVTALQGRLVIFVGRLGYSSIWMSKGRRIRAPRVATALKGLFKSRWHTRSRLEFRVWAHHSNGMHLLGRLQVCRVLPKPRVSGAGNFPPEAWILSCVWNACSVMASTNLCNGLPHSLP